MSFSQEMAALYVAKLKPQAARSIVYPVTGLGAGTGLGAICTAGAALTWGVWQDVALPAAVLVDQIATHVYLDTPSATETFAIQIGSTNVGGVVYASAAAVNAAAPAVILAAVRQEIRFHYIIVGAAGYWSQSGIPLPIPIWYNTADGIIARISTVAGGTTLNVAVGCVFGVV